MYYAAGNFILFASPGSIKNCVWTKGLGNFMTFVKMEAAEEMDIDEPVRVFNFCIRKLMYCLPNHNEDFKYQTNQILFL